LRTPTEEFFHSLLVALLQQQELDGKDFSLLVEAAENAQIGYAQGQLRQAAKWIEDRGFGQPLHYGGGDVDLVAMRLTVSGRIEAERLLALKSPPRIGEIWSSLRGVLNTFSFYDIKEICAEAGVPINRIAEIQQGQGTYHTKGQLLDAIDGLLEEMLPDVRDRVASACVQDVCSRKPEAAERLEQVLPRVGWTIVGGAAHPLALASTIGLGKLPEGTQRALDLALRRYRAGDISGAFTSICGMIDDLTRKIYETDTSLGDFAKASYQERATKAFKTLEGKFSGPLGAAGLSAQEIRETWQNYAKAVSQSAYVLSTFRRNFADVHGWSAAPAEFVQHALDCSAFIVNSFVRLTT